MPTLLRNCPIYRYPIYCVVGCDYNVIWYMNVSGISSLFNGELQSIINRKYVFPQHCCVRWTELNCIFSLRPKHSRKEGRGKEVGQGLDWRYHSGITLIWLREKNLCCDGQPGHNRWYNVLALLCYLYSTWRKLIFLKMLCWKGKLTAYWIIYLQTARGHSHSFKKCIELKLPVKLLFN